LSVDHAAGLRLDAALDGDDASVPDGDVETRTPVGQGGVADEEVESH
jgi:hypothetical protein